MKKFLFSSLISFVLSAFFFVDVFAVSRTVTATILPGVFYISIFGDLENGINLEGLGPPGPLPQVGTWTGEKNVDYLQFFDHTAADGFRIQFFLDSDFIYIGSDASQADIPASNFVAYAEWDEIGDSAVIPTKAIDDNQQTLSINSAESCPMVSVTDYEFNSEFLNDDFGKEFSIVPYNYLTSYVDCPNQGILNLGRLELNMGYPSPGEYQTSMYVIMIDGD